MTDQSQFAALPMNRPGQWTDLFNYKHDSEYSVSLGREKCIHVASRRPDAHYGNSEGTDYLGIVDRGEQLTLCLVINTTLNRFLRWCALFETFGCHLSDLRYSESDSRAEMYGTSVRAR